VADPAPARPALDAARSRTIIKGLRVIELKAQVEHPLREEVGERAVWARFCTSTLLRRTESRLHSVNSDSDRLRCLLAPRGTRFCSSNYSRGQGVVEIIDIVPKQDALNGFIVCRLFG